MRTRLLVPFILLLLVPIGPAAAIETVDGSVGPIFGGASVAANVSGASEIEFADLKPIGEDFTASWCVNCVPAEEALHEVADQREATVIHIHRHPDGEDPFGIPEGMDWWERRYGEPLPPMVAINGAMTHLGSKAAGDSLVEDYDGMFTSTTLDLGVGDSQFIWALSEDNASGMFVWSLQADMNHSLFAQSQAINSWLFIIEEKATFEDGSNELGDYPYVTRAIIDLGLASEGEVEVVLPQAWDGDDLSLVLIHEIIPVPQAEEVPLDPQLEGSGLPAPGLLPVICMIGLAAFMRRDR